MVLCLALNMQEIKGMVTKDVPSIALSKIS